MQINYNTGNKCAFKKYFNLYTCHSRGAAARGVNPLPTGCGFESHSRRWNINLNLYFHFFTLVSRLSAALSSATQHAMSLELGRKWGTEWVNTRFPLPTLLCAAKLWLHRSLNATLKFHYTITHTQAHTTLIHTNAHPRFSTPQSIEQESNPQLVALVSLGLNWPCL